MTQPTAPTRHLAIIPPSPTISLVLIDDNLEREGIVARIRAEPGFRVLAASAEVEEALKQVRETEPDVVLLSLRGIDDESLTLAGALHGEAPESRVVILGFRPEDHDVIDYVRAGAAGFIMAGASFDVALRTIQLVAHGTKVLPQELTGGLFGRLTSHGSRMHAKHILDIKGLTERERAVTELIVQGLSNKAIAARLKIGLYTVKSHVHNLLAKLSLNSRLEVAAFSRSRLSSADNSPEPADPVPHRFSGPLHRT